MRWVLYNAAHGGLGKERHRGTEARRKRATVLGIPTDTLRVWTIQRMEAWKSFRRDGVLGGDGRRIWSEFRPAYHWLKDQMARRIAGYSGGYPVWLWHVPKPDLRSSGHLPRGARGIRIELEMPRARILLMDFQAWHCTLMGQFLELSAREDREWKRRAVRRSWERVFDLPALNRSRLWRPVRQVQGVTEYVRMEEVTEIRPFTAR